MRENMQTIVLVMRRKPIAQSLVGRLQDNPDAQIILAPDYDNSEAIIFNSKANVVLIEAAESGDYGIAYCLELCERLRKDAPKCDPYQLTQTQSYAEKLSFSKESGERYPSFS
jgi:hypothetical protein